MPDTLLVKGMAVLGDVSDEVVSRVRGALMEWSHLLVFHEEHRERVAEFLGVAPSMGRYVYAWRICGRPLSQLHALGFSFSRETKSVTVWSEGDGNESLVGMLTAPELPGDCSVHGELAACGPKVMRNVVYVANPLSLDLLPRSLPTDFVVPSLCVDGEEEVVVDDVHDVSTRVECDGGVADSLVVEGCDDTVSESVGGRSSVSGPALDSVPGDVGTGGVLSVADSVDKERLDSGFDIDAGVGERVDLPIYLQCLKPAYRLHARDRFGDSVSYAALLGMPLHWFLLPDDVRLRGDWHGHGQWGDGGVGLSRLFSAIAVCAVRQGWLFPRGSLGEQCADSGSYTGCLPVPDLSDEFVDRELASRAYAEVGGSAGAVEVWSDDPGYCYRLWQGDHPGLRQLGPWPTRRAMEGVGVQFRDDPGDCDYYFHAASHCERVAPHVGVVGALVGVYENIEAGEPVKRRVKGWEVLDSGRDGPGAVLKFAVVDGKKVDVEVVFDDRIEIESVSRGGTGSVGLAHVQEIAAHCLRCDGTHVTTSAWMIGNKVVKFEVGDMSP